MKCRYFLLKEDCHKLFSSMDSFWVEDSGKRVDICWLVKVILKKLRRSNKQLSRKSCLLFQVILAFKNDF